ncbi:MAG TPA: hypothetical protein VFQ06_11310 [Nitrospira sp.]|nr:hypothetical protein [Nitrospira sp.]
MQEVISRRTGAVIVGFVLVALAYVLAAEDAQAWPQQASRNVTISCAQDIDAVINADPSGTTTRFVLDDSCTHVASEVVDPKDGDEIVCETAPTVDVLFGSNPATEPTAYDPSVQCQINGSAGSTNVMHPDGSFFMEGVRVSGGAMPYNGTGTGAGIGEGQMDNDSWIQFVRVTGTPALGISNAHGVHHGIELDNTTTDSSALGVTGSGIKGVDEFNVQHSYIRANQGNGIWCDVYCNDVTNAPFSVAHFNSNLIQNNGRAGIRYEEANDSGEDSEPTAGETIIENNRVFGNATEVGATHGGVDVRDAAHALIRDNIFDNNADGIAVRVSDSNRSDRPDVADIDIIDNILNGDTISGNRDCSQPDTITLCSGNTP